MQESEYRETRLRATPTPGFLSTPTAHAAALHAADRPGRVALAHKIGPRRGDWEERAYAVEELPDVLPAVAGESDVYLSTQRFWGWRRIAQLAELGALAVDVDYHRIPELADSHPHGILEDALTLLQRAQITEPSLAISSGRGLYLLWLHGPVPRAALPRWNACQKRLWEVLKPLGADRGALDAARVLRVIGTRHSKAGTTVEALTPLGAVWDFGDLADEVLPVTRAELHDLRIQRAARRAQRPSKRLWTPPEGFTQATLWEARLTDLQRLRDLRWFGEPMPDFRDRWLFVAGVGMSWLAEPVDLQRELFALAREIGGWTEGHTRSKMHAIFRTAKEAAKGKRVEWEGAEFDPRYRFRNSTLLEWFEITADEEREMSTIVSADERRRRDRERKSRERRESGEVKQTRDEYLAVGRDRRSEAHRLRSEERLSVRQIAARLNISKSQVHRLLTGDSSDCPMSVRLYGGVAPAEGSIAHRAKGSEATPEGGSGADEEESRSSGERGDVIQSEAEVFELARAWFGLEPEADRRDLARCNRQREGYRRRHETKPDKAPTEREMDARREERENVREGVPVEESEPERVQEPDAALALALRAYLDRNPHGRSEPASWLANTLWCFDLYPGKPTAPEVEAALLAS